MIDNLIAQTRKPVGFLGLIMARGMNFSHHRLTNWALNFINIKDTITILDIGCGGGKTIQKLAKLSPHGIIYGIDYSEEAIAISGKVNKKKIKEERIFLKVASVSSLPFENDFFDLITAVQTYFFWPDLHNDMKEVLRVLKPGGTCLIVSGEYKNEKFDRRNKIFVEKLNMHYHSPDDLKKLFMESGFQSATINENYNRGWLCGIALK